MEPGHIARNVRWIGESSPDDDFPIRLADGAYEYEFVLDGRHDHPVADPYAEEITKFGGYRGIFHMVGGKRWLL